MLTPQDDLLGHPTSGTFDGTGGPTTQAGNGDPRFTERYWYTGQPLDGTPIIFDIGLGYYPNKGVMDAFAGVTIGRKQINFRASRRLAGNPLESTVGPLKIQVEEGQSRHRVTLGENGSGIFFDFQFQASFPAAKEKQSYRERKGVVEEDLARVAQLGRWQGWIVADGKRYTVEPATWWGQRDRSWGIRSEMRTDDAKPPVQTHSNFFWTWSMFQCESVAVSIFLKEREAGKPYYLSGAEFVRQPDGSVKKREATGATHDLVWADDPLGQSIESATLRLEFEEGPPRELRLQALPTRFYLKGGLYGGFGGWNHGDDRGEYEEAHDVWNLDDPQVRARARTLSDHVVRVTTDGLTGIGIAEYGVAEGFARYPAPQRFPAL
ncbi:hypothetical protein [Caenimonas aquaedulcis]|uniref:Uncharacterized protein n=1 Tax=Caenimonas aquaedulcis TaxID=2793270 RepID=A0A931MGH0_9BURK|nr:hypothetical protein [Caenimonas aquaedulcis]MBG9388037.1 hypothetical protein [Caenimonas aquaedulcis]